MKTDDSNIPDALKSWLATFNLARPANIEYTPEDMRKALSLITRQNVSQIPEIPAICDSFIKGDRHTVPVRIYHPLPEQVLPVTLFVHGGGHVAGCIETYDPIARKLALATRSIVASIDYRLAPEHPYPSAIEDVVIVAESLFTRLQTLGFKFRERLDLIGDSGGGAVCASVAHRYSLANKALFRRQVLIYPSLDYTLSFPSIVQNGKGYLLEYERIQWLFDCYLRNSESRREVSPLYMPVNGQYPETLVITAQFCPLRDEGIAYAEKLSQSGVRCEQKSYAGMVHAFMNLEDIVASDCASLYQDIGEFLA